MGLNEELVGKAKELGIDTEDFENDESLKTAISEIEAKNKSDDDTDDVDKLKEKLRYLQDENKKAFASRDAAKKEKRTYQQKLDDFEKRLKDSPDPEEVKKLKSEYSELKKFKEEIEKQREEEEFQKADELKKTQIRFEKQFNELKAQMEQEIGKTQQTLNEKEKILKEKDSEISELRVARLRSEIMEYASKFKAYNPKQVARLLQDDFEYDDKINSFFHYSKDNRGKIVDELSIEDRVKAFLEDPENDNLVESSARSGTDHKDTDNKEVSKKSGTSYNKKDESLKEKAEWAGLDVDSYIEIQKKKDEKLKKIREKANS
jgi:hypothetical protein